MSAIEEVETHVANGSSNPHDAPKSRAQNAIDFAHQAEKLAQYTRDQETSTTASTQAVEAKFITAQDPVIITADGKRLPTVPLHEALELNRLKDRLEDGNSTGELPVKFGIREAKDGTVHGIPPPKTPNNQQPTKTDTPLSKAVPPARTNPLFPPLPMYGPPSPMRNAHYLFFRFTSAILSQCFLLVIVLGSFFTIIPKVLKNIGITLRFQRPSERRLFYHEEERRRRERKAANEEWAKIKNNKMESDSSSGEKTGEQFIPTEGGPDKLQCDVGYYARRVGLDSETFLVQTEDGFIIELWHIYNPLTTPRRSSVSRQPQSPDIFTSGSNILPSKLKDSKYPVLLIHGLLQSSGAYCCTDENSLAFYLAKSGLDVWLGNNRCGFTPRHSLLHPSDPRMWAWNIRQMGVMDLPALISRVLSETGYPKLALVAHSQGTTQTLVALAKEQRPEIGRKISVVCLLAPAAYAGPLIGKMYFKFMRVISPAMFRCFFGIHAFIPFMMSMHRLLPAKFYGFMGYRVFSFLFNWTDSRWERDLRNRCFQFAPVYVSAESMRWWLGRECFARQKCILSTKREMRMENQEDEEDDLEADSDAELLAAPESRERKRKERGRYAWYDEQVPPFALWVAGSDDLVDGKRLLRRFERGREPHVEVVHSKIIEGYEHLDVIWAIDSIEQVGKEVLETIWRTLPNELRQERCRVPVGCENVEFWNSGKIRGEDGIKVGTNEEEDGVEELNCRGRERLMSL
ncbi:hypothetical protein BLS_008817 [Venturia inaequalis]|uniref:Partial AB-hydrolase lipase domain-containing protein n=1 Tax=Venturia inaequalis TaxID=5025 RepID=A0A8H3V8V0_VENIN|nr:hypothetical protein BLS_008817 [Venturia inaequalis]KAE9982519.1 hypothetical protein EG328_010801 [Venturia inaequalis]RDI80298.1 U4/U6 small nuclear ribonucleoprotein [Venturia inaequalis]